MKVIYFLLLLILVPAIYAEDESFYILGHVAGFDQTISPANTVLANIETFNQGSQLVLLGDNYNELIPVDVNFFKSKFLDKINVPVYNAIGNHDVTTTPETGNLTYESIFGNRYYSFKKNNNLYIFLDTVSTDGLIVNQQYQFLINALKNVSDVNNVFIFSHRIIWDEYTITRFATTHETSKNIQIENSYEFSIELYKLSKIKKVYWFSGEIANKNIFYYQNNNVVYIATCIQENYDDAAIKVDIKNDNVEITGISLIDGTLFDVSQYDEKYWSENMPTIIEKFKAQIKTYFNDPTFKLNAFTGFVGGLTALIVLFIFYIIYKVTITTWLKK